MQVEILPLLEQLRAQVVQITFTKADGSMRVMNATLQSEHLPETQSATSGSGGSPSQTITVWDMDVQEWRSIRLDRIQNIQL